MMCANFVDYISISTLFITFTVALGNHLPSLGLYNLGVNMRNLNNVIFKDPSSSNVLFLVYTY